MSDAFPSSGNRGQEWSARRLVAGTLVVLAVALSFWLVYQHLWLLAIVFLGLVLASGLEAPVEWLWRRGVPRWAGTLGIYALLVGVFVGLLVLAGPIVVDQATGLGQALPGVYAEVVEALRTSPSLLIRRLGVYLPAELPLSFGGGNGSTLGALATSFVYAGSVTRTLLAMFAVFLFGYYWLLERRWLTQRALLLLPSERRERSEEMLDAVLDRMGGFVRTQTILCLIVGLLSLVAYLVIGLPYAFLLAVVAGVLEAVPMIGPTLAAVPPIIVALGISPATVVWVVVAAVVIQLLENNFLAPRVVRSVLGTNPVVTILTVAALGSFLGLPGVIIAVPIAALAQMFFRRLVLEAEQAPEAAPRGRAELDRLRYEVQDLARDLEKRLQAAPTGVVEHPARSALEDEMGNIIADLEALLTSPQAGEEATR